MLSAWNEDDAKKSVRQYEKAGISADLAIRTYSARLLGSDPKLVIHGGGNTSVKSQAENLLGHQTQVIHIKGSGWDLSSIEPPGHPAVRLEPLLGLSALDKLSDEQMVNQLRINLLDASSPNPSVETLLHAFLPHKFIDHTHANAILALVNLSDSKKRIRDVFGSDVAIVPYIMPGFALAKAAAEAWEKHKPKKGLILIHHGIFSFGESAKESYEYMIELVDRAENAIRKKKIEPFSQSSSKWMDHMPVLRGALNSDIKNKASFIIHFRTSENIQRFVNHPQLKKLSQKGPPTPDHVIRTKRLPLLLNPQMNAQEIREAVKQYRVVCHKEFNQNQSKRKTSKQELDTTPRVILIPGVGMVTSGNSLKAAKATADIYEQTAEIILQAEQMGTYKPLDPQNLFDMEYWDLEQAKLKKDKVSPLAGKVVLVTGAGSGIGKACAELFSQQGAHLVLMDINDKSLTNTRENLVDPQSAIALKVDVTNNESVQNALLQVLPVFGGVDFVISNAGKAFTSAIDKCNPGVFHQSLDINLLSHQIIASACMRIFKSQQTGGSFVFNASKSAFSPGPGFGPYSIAKAGLIALMRQYAVEGGEHGITSNAVNADRVRTGLFADGMLEERAKARNLSVTEYLSGNLLKQEVLGRDVAEAVLYLALARKTTGSVIPVDGGNMAAAPR